MADNTCSLVSQAALIILWINYLGISTIYQKIYHHHDAVVDNTTVLPTIECSQQPVAPTLHPLRGNMGNRYAECPTTTEDLTLSTPKSKINKSMKASRTPSMASKDSTIDGIHYALCPRQWEGCMRTHEEYGLPLPQPPPPCILPLPQLPPIRKIQTSATIHDQVSCWDSLAATISIDSKSD